MLDIFSHSFSSSLCPLVKCLFMCFVHFLTGSFVLSLLTFESALKKFFVKTKERWAIQYWGLQKQQSNKGRPAITWNIYGNISNLQHIITHRNLEMRMYGLQAALQPTLSLLCSGEKNPFTFLCKLFNKTSWKTY